MDGIERVASESVEIEFEGARCIHSRHCVLGRPDVFVPNVEGAWIHPERATADEVAELAQLCPSGAIRYRRLDGGPQEKAPIVNTVRVRENGPLAFHAPLSIAGGPAGFRATLCRCGHSRNKPYCDGAHAGAGFAASGEPATKASEPLAVRNGAVNVKPLLNGPLQVDGSVELVSGTGRTLDRTTQAWLCRCGQSANKPYCDGTHKRVGFVADGEARPSSSAKG
jgi:CDGSH-type Zn-finger protein/uncharacterized Fe-S cluster protein YjdI